MRYSLSFSLLALSVFLSVGCVSVTDMNSLQSKVERLNSEVQQFRLDRQEDRLEIKELGEDMTNLRRAVEEASQRSYREEPPQKTEVAEITPTPAEALRRPAVEKADELYMHAYSRFAEGKYDEAHAIFSNFLERFPRHELADNAQYWIGECFYSQYRYEDAIAAFLLVKEHHPFGNKVPDAILKVGLSYYELNQAEEGSKYLERVMDLFPETHAALIARERLRP